MQPDLIATFVAELLKKAGLEDVPQSFYDEYSEKIGVEVQKRLGLIAMRELTPEAVDKFGELVSHNAAPEEMANFFKENISEYEEKISVALKEFADEFLSSAAKLKQTA